MRAAARAILAAALACVPALVLADEAAAWAALRAGGHVALIRHASTISGIVSTTAWNFSSQAAE